MLAIWQWPDGAGEFSGAAEPMVIKAVNAAGAGIPNASVPGPWRRESALSDIVTTTDGNGMASALFRGVFLPPPDSYRRSVVRATVTAAVGRRSRHGFRRNHLRVADDFRRICACSAR